MKLPWLFDAVAVAALAALTTAVTVVVRPAARTAHATTRAPAPSPNAYGHALANLAPDHWLALRDGKAIFLTTWVEPGHADAERAARGPNALVRDGLGPRFNAASCETCHFRDGRGGPPRDAVSGPVAPPYLLRVGPDPRYGVQLQDHAVPPAVAEAHVDVAFHAVPGIYPDGTVYLLQAPDVTVRDLGAGALAADTPRSLRSPPPLIGLGLLEAVPDAELIALADPDDADHDGISGRVNRVAGAIGRFGWKAAQPSLWLQNATALREDLGVTTPVRPEPGAAPELAAADLERLTRYTRLLGPPARRDLDDAGAARGEQLFGDVGCTGCHRARLTTGDVADFPELAHQTIAPYTDLLLHDLGDGLADDRPDGDATGHEWRTAPLWGLGLARVVNGDVRLLHDGRARSAEEAILWHGGEARAARDRFTRLGRRDRAAVLRFLAAL